MYVVFLLNIQGTDAQLLINEVCASNSSVLSDTDGEYNDWIELTNTSAEPVNLEGYGLGDDSSLKEQWNFLQYYLQPGEFLVVFASGKDIKTTPSQWKTIVKEGDTWRYIVPGANEDGWRKTGYDDSWWQAGAGGIGYGDGDDVTVISQSLSVYMRKSFVIEDAAEIREAVLHMDYDDGFVAYINGIEIGRVNLSGDPPEFNTLASPDREAQMYSGGRPERFDIADPGTVFRNGENVLAIEVHNVSETSSDMSAIPFLSVMSQLQSGSPAPEVLGLSSETFHTNFRLDADGDTLYLTGPAGKVTDSLIIRWQVPDHSFGRKPGIPGEWYLFDLPTPGSSNVTFAYQGYVETQPVFSRPGGRITDPFQLTISAPPGDSIYYTTDGTTPHITSALYADPVAITGNTVVKAVILKHGYLPGKVVAHSYIANAHEGLPVLSISTNPYNLWDHEYGMYVMGPNASNNFPYFGANFWNDWERPVHVEMYDEHDSLAFSIGAGMKIYGGYTRGHPQKSVSLFARAEYGDRKVNYQLFPDAPIYDFEAFVLRNSGNDWFGQGSEAGSMYRDILMTSLTESMHIEYQKARQAVLYLNGAYWGIHNIREKINEHFLASNTGVDPDRVELLTNNQDVIIGSNDHYRNLFNFVGNSNMALEVNYNYVCQRMEIQNFIHYELAQIYFDNKDWPGNNIKYWRPAYRNGRWRWIIYDTDFGFGLWNRNNVSVNTLEFALDPDNNAWPNPSWSTLLLRKLLDNQEFKYRFINTFADQINTSFEKKSMDLQIDSLKQRIEGEMVQHTNRWGGNYQTWVSRTNDLKYFASLRSAMVQSHIISTFGLGGKHDLKLDVAGNVQGTIKLNTLLISDFPWTGTYFEDVPVVLTAVSPGGYEFAGWSGDTQSDAQCISIDLSSAHSLTAHFEPAEDPFFSRVIINEICYAPDSVRSSEDWVELHNRSDQYVDLSGWKLQDSKGEHMYRISEGTVINPYGYYVVCRDKFKFRELHADFDTYEGNFNFGLSSVGDVVRLYDAENTLVNIVSYEPASPWPDVPEGFTLSLRSPEMDNFSAGAWEVSGEKYGTPGSRNFEIPDGIITEESVSGDLLLGNYPNPFTGNTTVTLYSDTYQHLKLVVYDLHGRQVEVLADRKFRDGFHEINWTPSTAPGMYILQLETPDSIHMRRVLKVK
ncbi:MAG: CotH kinase family protein [Bacteroidales bacterium]|nr:CotH kinase family protein [Bacteroidales bacterium]